MSHVADISESWVPLEMFSETDYISLDPAVQTVEFKLSHLQPPAGLNFLVRLFLYRLGSEIGLKVAKSGLCKSLEPP